MRLYWTNKTVILSLLWFCMFYSRNVHLKKMENQYFKNLKSTTSELQCLFSFFSFQTCEIIFFHYKNVITLHFSHIPQLVAFFEDHFLNCQNNNLNYFEVVILFLIKYSPKWVMILPKSYFLLQNSCSCQCCILPSRVNQQIFLSPPMQSTVLRSAEKTSQKITNYSKCIRIYVSEFYTLLLNDVYNMHS